MADKIVYLIYLAICFLSFFFLQKLKEKKIQYLLWFTAPP